MNKYLGSCLCGEVWFEIIGDFERFSCVTAGVVERTPGRRTRPTCFHQPQRSIGCQAEPRSRRFTSHRRGIRRVFARNVVQRFLVFK